MSSPPPQSVRFISDCFIKPPELPPQSNHPLHLPPWDLAMISVHYIQKGLLFPLPFGRLNRGFDRPGFMRSFLEKLKRSLSSALFHFYPLAGRLATLKQKDPPFYTIFVDCANSPGARFIHAKLDMNMAEILAPTYVPAVVLSFFDHDRAINHDGHTLSLLSVQVTELVDGIFIGLSMNHTIGDGSSFWLFFNSWSEIFQAQEKGAVDVVQLSRPPVLTRWFPENHPGPLSLPYTDDPSSFLSRFEAPELRERVFHFSADAIVRLKAEANRQSGTTDISSFKSLTALVWRCITRARHFPPSKVTGCRMAANNRARLDPPLSPDYFGNSITPVRTEATAGEVLGNGLGWAALLLHVAVAEHSNAKLRKWHEEWIKRPQIYLMDKTFDPSSVMMGSSPRFNKYGSEFGRRLWLCEADTLTSSMARSQPIRAMKVAEASTLRSAFPRRRWHSSKLIQNSWPPSRFCRLEGQRQHVGHVQVESMRLGIRRNNDPSFDLEFCIDLFLNLQ